MAEASLTAAGEVTLDKATYEELAQIELEFEDIDNEMVAKQYLLSQPTYAKRAVAISKIPFFWAAALEAAPPDIDQFIQPSDSAIFAACLKSIVVERFEVPSTIPPTATHASPAQQTDPSVFGEPRSLLFRFEFSENEYFEDSVLEKKFWFRRCKDGWSGRVSEPVKIRWKPGKDVTEGLTDAACDLWEAQKKLGVPDGEEHSTQLARRSKVLPEFAKLTKMVDESVEGSLSFFAWFAGRGRWVGEEESRIASKVERERNEKLKRGEEVPDDDEEMEDDDELDMAEMSTEVFPAAEDLALAVAEDLWPGAIRYFTESQEQDLLSDSDFEVDEMDEDEVEDGDEEVMDIRSLVKNGSGPPPKKRRT